MNKMKGANMNSYIQRSKRSICKETKSLTQKYNYPKQNIKSSFLLLMTNIGPDRVDLTADEGVLDCVFPICMILGFIEK